MDPSHGSQGAASVDVGARYGARNEEIHVSENDKCEARFHLIRWAEMALDRGDMATAVELRAKLVSLIPEPPKPVLPALRRARATMKGRAT